ncbi:hypothetical protein J2D78_09785 [Microbacterium maritypicum]|uniref:hypothetical protein n=1 Tax=Microbacterium maritypicum TaxID=33918 RepID=UPI001B319511|nr:hypothetical protein [Microbacterium liquefaciens]MBP5802372.1 hypothetical protein [Microbacterium liquefaciens]
MTDAETPSEASETPETPFIDDVTPDELRVKDWMLEDLVRIFDNDGSAIGITIQSNGATISGLLIGADEYLRRVGETFEQSPVPDMKVLPELWGKSLADTNDWLAERDSRGLARPARRFLHMRDARILTGSQPVNVPLWRGNLSDITGWALGSIPSGQDD